MASHSQTTKDHDQIRQWAEDRGGKPAHVKNTESAEDIGILRLEFPGATASNDSNLEEISWDDFFEKFDERGLALVYQEETAEGQKSNFNKLISSETAADAESGTTKKTVAKSSKRTRPPAKKTVTKTAVKKAIKKSAPVKKAVKNAAPKKVAAKKVAAKKAAPKKAAPKKAIFKKVAAKKVVAKKTAPLKKAAKKAAPKKTAGRRR